MKIKPFPYLLLFILIPSIGLSQKVYKSKPDPFNGNWSHETKPASIFGDYGYGRHVLVQFRQNFYPNESTLDSTWYLLISIKSNDVFTIRPTDSLRLKFEDNQIWSFPYTKLEINIPSDYRHFWIPLNNEFVRQLQSSLLKYIRIDTEKTNQDFEISRSNAGWLMDNYYAFDKYMKKLK